MYSLKDILYAKSIAVVGASGNSRKTGHIILKNILDGGYEGKLYPVNLKEDCILGLKCFRSIAEIPGQLDLAVVCVPALQTPAVIREAGEKGVKGAIVISGGFKETGNGQLEEDMLRTAKSYGMRIVGPNCQGINYTGNRMCATWPLVKSRGPIGVVSQSGTVGAEMELLAEKDAIGVSCFAALGNKSDVDETDFIDFFLQDPETKVIALYMEGIHNAGAFVKAVARAAKEKPVVILKPGRTEKGIRAVSSHTRSIAGNDRIFSAFCKKHGILRANNLTEFYDFCKIAAFSAKPAGNRMLIVSSSGGAGIMATDTAEGNKLDVSGLSDALKLELEKALPAQCVVSNPLDLTGDATCDRYDTVLEAVGRKKDYDILLTIFGDPIWGAYEVVSKQGGNASVPVVVSYLGGGGIQDEETERMGKGGIPVFPTPERAVAAIGALLKLKTS